MIQITRAQARRWRAVLRRAVASGGGRWAGPTLVFTADRDGLHLQCATPQVAVDYHQPGALPEDRLTVPAPLLADCEGGKDEPVVLERGPGETVRACWHDGGVPQQQEYAVPEADPALNFPALPQRWLPQAPDFLPALKAVAQTAARQHVRYSLHRVQFQGKAGQLVATDGKQLLLHAGFRFGWSDNILVPALPVWCARDLPSTESLSLGRTETHVFIRVGPWTFALLIDRQGRFPNVADVVPSPAARRTTWTLTAPAAALLARTLPRLPGGQDAEQPVTVDLNSPVAVRARAERDGRTTELLMPESQVSGPALRCCGNRQYLLRALALGFTRFELAGADQPIVACDDRRTYLWMTLPAKDALPAAADAVRVSGVVGAQAGEELSVSLRPVSGPGRAKRTDVDGAVEPPWPRKGAAADTNGEPAGAVPKAVNDAQPPAPAATHPGLLQEAEALRDLLRDGYLRSQRLLAALKRQRQQSRLLNSTVSALRQLRLVES
ncbi:MAG: hypothetical protein JNM56_12275 [Planctomycetia bacterium]|nr:hypothetical protein [Planctomycetia bacterium]